MRNRFRTTFVTAAAAALVSVSTAVAIAVEPVPTPPSVAIESPTSASSLVFSTFPTTVPVTGSVSFTGGTGAGNLNLCAVKDLTVTVYDALGTPDRIGYLESVASRNGTPSCDATSTGWAFDWAVPAAGSYRIVATAHVKNDDGTDEVTVLVEQAVVADFPAAPAVANELLKDSPVKGKVRGHCVAAVADHMGPQTDFDGVAKEQVAEYRAAVDAFLVSSCEGYSA